jgi:hypothetical protein
LLRSKMRRRFRLNQGTTTIVNHIKKTMHEKVPPHGFTVFRALSDRERQNAFSRRAANQFPEIRRAFDDAIQDFVVVMEGRVSTRKARKIARNAWKEDPGANRRAREQMKHCTKSRMRSIHRGRPEVYDRQVVYAFADAIAKAAGRKRFPIGHRSDVTIRDNKNGGAMLCTLVAAVEWALTIVAAGSSEAVAPRVKPESILAIIKGRPLTKSTE